MTGLTIGIGIALIWVAGFTYATYKVTLDALVEAYREDLPDSYNLLAAAVSAVLSSVRVLSWSWWWYLAGDAMTGRPSTRQLRAQLAALHTEAMTGRRDLPNRYVYTFDAHQHMLTRTRAEERARLAAHLRNIPDNDHGPRTGTRRFIDRHPRLRDGSSMVAVLLAAADEIENLETNHA